MHYNNPVQGKTNSEAHKSFDSSTSTC